MTICSSVTLVWNMFFCPSEFSSTSSFIPLSLAPQAYENTVVFSNLLALMSQCSFFLACEVIVQLDPGYPYHLKHFLLFTHLFCWEIISLVHTGFPFLRLLLTPCSFLSEDFIPSGIIKSFMVAIGNAPWQWCKLWEDSICSLLSSQIQTPAWEVFIRYLLAGSTIIIVFIETVCFDVDLEIFCTFMFVWLWQHIKII